MNFLLEVILVVLFLLALLCLPVALIRPSVFTPLFRRNLGRAQTSLLFAGAIIVLFVVIGVLADAGIIGSQTTSKPSVPATNQAKATVNTPTPQQQPQGKQPTVTPTIDEEKQAIARYASQVETLVAPMSKENEIIAQDATNASSGNDADVQQLRTDAVTAETMYKGAQQELNTMNVPPEMTTAQSYLTTAMTDYIQGLDEVVKGIDDNDNTELTAGANVYTQGTQELNKATVTLKAYLAQTEQ